MNNDAGAAVVASAVPADERSIGPETEAPASDGAAVEISPDANPEAAADAQDAAAASAALAARMAGQQVSAQSAGPSANADTAAQAEPVDIASTQAAVPVGQEEIRTKAPEARPALDVADALESAVVEFRPSAAAAADSAPAPANAGLAAEAAATRLTRAAEAGAARDARSASSAGAAKPDADPLARLIESARVVQRAQTGAAADPIVARLREVEGSIARDRVAQSIERGELALSADTAATPSAQGGAAATATVAGNALQPVPGRDAAAAPGAFSALDAGTASPAPDLGAAEAPDAHPSAQLAAKGVGILANQRGGAITMRLEPPALGQLRIELHISQGAVVADFTAATPEARVLLEANLGMLRERLESQGLSVERISVHGGRGTESAAPITAPGGGDARQDGAGARSDSGDRGERSGTRQDAAGGESRGRREGDARAQRDRTDAEREGGSRGFAAALNGETARRTEPMRRAG